MGRVEGKISADGQNYELKQGDVLLSSWPIEDAKKDVKLAAAIKRNRWEPLP